MWTKAPVDWIYTRLTTNKMWFYEILSPGSRLDYYNSVLFNVTEKEILKLQGVHNCLVRVVTKSPRFDQITPLLKSLHWPLVCYRIKVKLCSLTYQALTSGQPVYYSKRAWAKDVLYVYNVLEPSWKLRTLRSSDLNDMFHGSELRYRHQGLFLLQHLDFGRNFL